MATVVQLDFVTDFEVQLGSSLFSFSTRLEHSFDDGVGFRTWIIIILGEAQFFFLFREKFSLLIFDLKHKRINKRLSFLREVFVLVLGERKKESRT